MTLLQLAALAVILWLPGAVFFRLPWADRERRAALDPEERAFWAVVLSCAWSLAGVLLLAASGSYTLGRLLLLNVVVSLVAAGAAGGRLRLHAPRHISLAALLPLALALFCAFRFAPSAEYLIGGKDPGTYVNEGIQIAQRGSIRIHEPVVSAVPQEARDLFFPEHLDPEGRKRPGYYGIRFMGFFLKDPASGLTVGQFPHLFPASLAVGYSLGGIEGMRRVTPFWAVLAVLAVYFTGARLFGRFAAGAAALLLALNVITTWFGRYPNSEVVMLAMLFAALLANARAHVDGDRFFAPVAGALLGLLLYLGVYAVIGIVGVAAGVLLGMFAGQRPRIQALIGFAVPAIPAAFYYLGPLRAYAVRPIEFVQGLPWWQMALIGVAAAVALAAVRAASSRPAVRDAITRYAPLSLAVVLCALGVYALYLRQPGGRLTAHDAYALRTYAQFYVTVPAVLAAMIGLLLYARRGFWRDPALFTTTALFATFIFFKLRIVPEHFWAARRFLPVILPATLLFACAAALGGGGGGLWARIRPLLGIVLVALLGARYARASAPVAEHVEYAQLTAKLSELARTFGDNDLIIAEARDAQSDVHVIATPLAYVYGRNVLVLSSAKPDKNTFAAFLDWAKNRYPRVVFIGGGGTDLLSDRYAVKPISSHRFQVPEYESPVNEYPRGVRRKEFEYTIYEFTPPQQPGASGIFDLDVGINDDLHVLRFYAKEETEGRTFRWTRATSYVSVTGISSTSRELTAIIGDGGRPAAAPPAQVHVFLHNQQIGSWTVKGPFKPYTLTIPADLAARADAAADAVELRFVTTTWNPAKVLGTPDTRILGVMVDRVTIK